MKKDPLKIKRVSTNNGSARLRQLRDRFYSRGRFAGEVRSTNGLTDERIFSRLRRKKGNWIACQRREKTAKHKGEENDATFGRIEHHDLTILVVVLLVPFNEITCGHQCGLGKKRRA